MSGKVTLTKSNFTAGEMSLDMLGRGDLSAYQNGAMRLRNVFISPIGGVSRRPGLRHVHGFDVPGRLVAFEFNTEQAYLLVFTDHRVDVFAGGVWQCGFATEWSEAQLAQINWTQSADTLLVVHPEVKPKKITRNSHTVWSMEDWSFYEKDGVVHQPYHRFAAEDVTLATSGQSGTITITASKDVFTTGHVGVRLRIKDKEVKVTAYTSAKIVTAEVKQTLGSTTATTDWEEQALSLVHGWPVSVCFHQDRLVIGGTRDLPNRLYLSKSSDLFNFDLGEALDDEAIEFALLSDQVNAIRAVFSGRHLQVFTSGAEWMVSGDPLTPSKIQLTQQTRVGSPVHRTVPPRDVDGATLFISRNGRDLREFLFADVEQAYQSTDLAMLAKHMLVGPVDQDYDPVRRLFHVVNSDGTIASLTVYRTEKVTAWTKLHTDGEFTSVTVVDGEVYVLVKRGAKYCVEALDDDYPLDAAKECAQMPGDPTRWAQADHLNGRTVSVLADGGALYDREVQGGIVELPEPASNVVVGLPFTMEIAPLPPVAQGGGGPGAIARLVRASFRLLDTRTFAIDTGRGVTQVPFRRFGRDCFDASPPAFSGDVTVRAIGWRRDVFQPLWRVVQDVPLPCTVLSVATEMKFSE